MITTLLQTLSNFKAYLVMAIVAIVVVFGSYNLGHYKGYNNGYSVRDTEATQQITQLQLDGVNEVERIRKEKQDAINQVESDYQKRLDSIQADTDRAIAKLKSDNVRLYVQVKRSASSGTEGSSNTGSVDEKAELSEGTSKFLIGQAMKCDVWIESLQNVINELNKERNNK